MNKLLSRFYALLILVVLAAVIGGFILLRREMENPTPSTRLTLEPARVKQITDMVRLCSLDMHEETGINDTINGKGLFAIQRLKGEITFDLTDVRVDSIGTDSLLVHLPKERVEILESTEPNSYRVVDVWNMRYPLLPTSLTTAEENTLKQRASERAKRLAYDRGHVARARAGAVESLRKMYSLLPDVTVKVTDDTPQGNR